MIIYGDLVVEKGNDGELETNRKLRFRSDGNILCGTRFRNFPDEIDNDVDLFIETFKNAILGLYNGDEKAVEKARKEEVKKEKEKAEKIKESEKNNPDELKKQIAEIIEGMEKTKKVKLAKEFKEILGNADYKKSDNKDDLLTALDVAKSL